MTFLRQLFGGGESANTAKERLKLVLVHDRADLSQARLDSMKDEMLDVISRYVKIDRRAVSISLTQDRHEQRLVADIPLASPRQRR